MVIRPLPLRNNGTASDVPGGVVTDDFVPRNEASDAETRGAIQLVLRAAVAVVALFWLASTLVHRDAYLVRIGLTEEAEFAVMRAETFDRQRVCGDRPVIWLLGSSITREAFDEHRLEALSPGWCVQKYAFGRGAPLFTTAMLDHIDLRAGDRVITSIAYDNFRKDWINAHGKFQFYIPFLLSARDIWSLPSLHPEDRAEYLLAKLPPQQFWRWRQAYREGLRREWWWWTGGRAQAPEPTLFGPRDPFQTRDTVPNFRTLQLVEGNKLPSDLLDTSDTQPNIAALETLQERTDALGVQLWVVHVPHNPEYYAAFTTPDVPARVHAWMEGHLTRYLRLEGRPSGDYLDYKHPNWRGRAFYTRELAAWLAVDGDTRAFSPDSLGPVDLEPPSERDEPTVENEDTGLGG